MAFQQAISSMSLGRACVHKLPSKLDQAKRFGYKGIEIFYEDVEYVAKEMEGGVTPTNLLKASRTVRELCDARGLTIIALQPFMHYEGLRDREEHARRVEQMRLWLKLARILGTDLIEIPSTFISEDECTGDFNTIVQDLREIADLGLQQYPPIRFAYEALAWGTWTSTWEQAYSIVCAVDRPNFGLVMDTFNMAARIYADPASPSGKTLDADAALDASIQRIKSQIDVRKLFFVQIVDAQRLSSPLVKGHELYAADQPSRMSWSRSCRLFYGEEANGAYLPVLAISKAIVQELGYKGWISAELFNAYMNCSDKDVPENLARRGAASWKKFCLDLDLNSPPKTSVQPLGACMAELGKDLTRTTTNLVSMEG
jgi:4-hydroxyphenylpyruvate dioxygenase